MDEISDEEQPKQNKIIPIIEMCWLLVRVCVSLCMTDILFYDENSIIETVRMTTMIE